jgi:hypothetical protein
MIADPLECCRDLLDKLVAEPGSLLVIPNRSKTKLSESFAMKVSRHGVA